MVTANAILVPVLETAIKDSLDKFREQRSEITLSDMYLFLDMEAPALSIYDDMEFCLLKISLEKEQDQIEDAFEEQFIASAKHALNNLSQAGAFNKDFIFQPFAVSMVDEDFIITHELFFLDDNTIKLDDDLLKNLDKELDDFLKNLLK